MTLTMTDQITDQLLAMSDSDFKEIVEQDIRGAAGDRFADALRMPTVIPRWHNHLMRIKTSVEGQMRSRELRFERDKLTTEAVGLRGNERDLRRLETEYAEWRRRISTFYTGLSEKVIEARGLLMEVRPDVESLLQTLEAYDKLLDRQNEIFKVIQRHRDNFPSDDEPSQDDEDLWALLDPQSSEGQ